MIIIVLQQHKMSLIFNAIVGIIGSGKSTYAKTFLANNLAMEYICPDLIREEIAGNAEDQSVNGFIFTKVLPQRILSAANSGRDILLDATNYRVKNRVGPFSLAKSLGYKVVAHVMQTPFEVCWARNVARSRVVPRHVYDRMVVGWDLPDTTKESYIDEIVLVPYIVDTILAP